MARDYDADLHLIVTKMAAAVTYCSRDLRYLWVSHRYAAWLGKTPEAIAGQNIIDVIGREAWEGIQDHVAQALAGERVEYIGQLTFAGLGPRWIHGEYTPVTNGWISVITDIDDQKRAELALEDANRRLLEADRRKSEFLALLSHELRNPLAPIRTSLEIVDRMPTDSDRARKAWLVIHRQSEQLTRLVDDLLDITRITSGRITLQREVLDLGALVQQAADDRREDFVAAGVALEIEPVPSALWVNADATRLAQAIGNLLQNALKFTPRGGKTTVSVARDPTGKSALVAVRDTGRGIPSEVLPQLFEPFVQTEALLGRKTGGLGLGLAIVNRILEMHGGSVSASSDGPGKGATFTLAIPLETAVQADADARSAATTRKAPLRVLLIEDNVDAANALHDLLELSGYATKVAYAGPEGLEEARTYRPDVVVCDIGLPGMDGYQVARTMRVSPGLERIKLIAVTGYGMADDVARAKDSGFDAHLTKPIKLASLKRVLDSLQ